MQEYSVHRKWRRQFAATLIATVAVLALVSMSGRAASLPAAAATHVQGDVDCSGSVTIGDAQKVARSLIGLSVTQSSGCPAIGSAASGFPWADIDCGGSVTIGDAQKIARSLIGLSVSQASGCTALGQPMGGGQSTFGKIDDAVTSGEISPETALVYKFYFTFADPRIPAQYQGDDANAPVDSADIPGAQSQFASLSPQAQALLAPFLIPPVYPGSWLYPPIAAQAGSAGVAGEGCSVPDWGCRDAATASVRVWWQTQHPEDAARAQTIADAMDTTIWPQLTALMGTPLPDGGASYEAGSPRLDIYLVDIARSVALSQSPSGCKHTPAYINLDRTASLSIVAHEFMHTIQWGYDVSQGCVWQGGGGEYNWLTEATATWAQDFIYPQGNEEQYLAEFYMSEPGQPLETANDKHEYGAYLFFQYLTRFYATNQLIRTVWNNTTSYGSLEAIERALPGGLEERWPPFAACLWNSPPADCFVRWDGLQRSIEPATPATPLVLDGDNSRTVEMPPNVEHMAASYARLVVSDDEIHSLTFVNTLADFPHAAVQALVKINDQWQGPADWTAIERKGFCLDQPAQQVQELVIIISNSDWENKGALLPLGNPRIIADKAGCNSWVGSVSVEESYYGATFTLILSGIVFQPAGSEPGDRLQEYDLVDASAATWQVSGTIPHYGMTCQASGEMHLLPPDGTHFFDGRLTGNLHIDTQQNTYYGLITGADESARVSLSCPDGSTATDTWPWVAPLVMGSEETYYITTTGVMDGVYYDPTFYSGTTWHWHLEPAPPP